MQVKLGDEVFRFYFQYQQEPFGVRYTTCFVDRMGSDGGWHKYVAGSARCSTSDQFVKEHGRKLALGRALGNNFDFEQRKEFWHVYLNRARNDNAKPFGSIRAAQITIGRIDCTATTVAQDQEHTT